MLVQLLAGGRLPSERECVSPRTCNFCLISLCSSPPPTCMTCWEPVSCVAHGGSAHTPNAAGVPFRHNGTGWHNL